MRKLPDCPKCEEDELWLWRGGDVFEVKCYLCGFSTGRVTLTTGQELNDIIAAKVEAAKEQPK